MRRFACRLGTGSVTFAQSSKTTNGPAPLAEKSKSLAPRNCAHEGLGAFRLAKYLRHSRAHHTAVPPNLTRPHPIFMRPRRLVRAAFLRADFSRRRLRGLPVAEELT